MSLPGQTGERGSAGNVASGRSAGPSPSMSPPSWAGGHKPSKIMRFVDKITKSKYFQKATETEFIKKKMEEVSNTPLLLTVEVQQLRGTLAVNIPPPPTDRIWYVSATAAGGMPLPLRKCRENLVWDKAGGRRPCVDTVGQ